MAAPRIEIEDSGAARALERLAGDLGDLHQAHAAIASQGASAASAFVPRRTGHLARSVRSRVDRNRAVVTVGNAQVDYAPFVGRGTDRMPASPFVHQTSRAMGEVADRLVAADIDRSIRRDGLS